MTDLSCPPTSRHMPYRNIVSNVPCQPKSHLWGSSARKLSVRSGMSLDTPSLGCLQRFSAFPRKPRHLIRLIRSNTTWRVDTVCRLSPFDPPPFDPSKLELTYLGDTNSSDPEPLVRPRCYTLTHNDVTGDLFLSVGTSFNSNQVSGWYNKLLRDEVLAEWQSDGLHVHCHVSGVDCWWLAPGSIRNFIFCREMPLV